MASIEICQIGSKKVKVIKVIREISGKGLKEASDFVDSVEKFGPRSIDLTTGTTIEKAIQSLEREGAIARTNGDDTIVKNDRPDISVMTDTNLIVALYTFDAFAGMNKGTISVYNNRFAFSSKKANTVYQFSTISGVKLDAFGNMEVTLKTGKKSTYTSTDEKIKQLVGFISSKIDPETEGQSQISSNSKPSFVDGFRAGYASGYDSVKEGDDFVDKITKLPYADTWGTKRDIKEMGKMLQDGEEVKAVASGFYEDRTWLFACTNRRVLAINKNLLIGGDQIEIPFRQIHAIAVKKGLMFSTVSVQTGTRSMDISNIMSDAARYFVDCVHKELEALENKSNTAQVIQQVKPMSEADEIRKFKGLLDDGIITQEEFDAKKKQLLGI